ncbi:15216_t:CDS:1, partial [Racocetra persica]
MLRNAWSKHQINRSVSLGQKIANQNTKTELPHVTSVTTHLSSSTFRNIMATRPQNQASLYVPEKVDDGRIGCKLLG